MTDTKDPVHEERGKPSHIMEHLSCFLPGLFALGVHTLPWDQFDSLNLNLGELASQGKFGFAGEGYRRLSGYKLKDLHMWAAEGLAQTCWLMYADQPAGLSPDEIVVRASAEEVAGPGTVWMDAMDQWKASGARGSPPGTKDTAPIVYTEKERLRGGIRGRDYAIKKHSYMLRPEVSGFFTLTGRWCERF